MSKKELKREYKLNHRPMGVYQIRNIANEKVFIGAALDLPGIFNRHKFQLKMGNHPDRALQAEWNEFGSESFVFEVLDEMTATNGVDYDYRADLVALEELWLEKLQPYDERGYNEKKKGKDVRLREIAKRRLDKQREEV